MAPVRGPSNERRWIVLGEDGRYVTLGRASNPDDAEIAAVEALLSAQGRAGWLAVMQGNPNVGAVPRVLEVRPLAHPTTPFDVAAEALVRSILAGRSQVA